MRKIIPFLLLFVAASLSAKVIATVDGYPIYERSANAFLRIATPNKIKFHQLKKKDKKSLVERLAVDTLVLNTALNDLSQKEQEQIIAGYWLRQKAAKFKVSEKEVKDAYTENKKLFKDKKGKTVPLKEVKGMIRNSLLQKKAVAKMMKKAKIVMGSKGLKKSKSSKSKNGKYAIYKIKSGDALSKIAERYNTTTKELRRINNMSKEDMIKIGQKLKIPNN